MRNEKRIEELTLKEIKSEILRARSSEEREQLIRQTLLFLFNEEDFSELSSIVKKINQELDEGW